MTINELNEMYKTGTQGEWKPYGFVVQGPNRVYDLTEPGQPIRQETIARICRMTSKDIPEEDEANRDFIAHVHNTWQAIYEVLKAAENFRHAADHVVYLSDRERLFRAVDALNATGQPIRTEES